MVLLPALLLLWVAPLSSCTDRLRTKFYLLEPTTQINDAFAACKANYTDLVTIYDKEENMLQAKMIMNASDCSWIGASGCTWSNGDAVTFINLSRSFTAERCCGVLTAGAAWQCLNCTFKMHFMCDEDGKPTLIPENKTWLEAHLYCRNNQSHLVSIKNQTQNEQVKESLNGSNSVWIGLQYNYKVVWSDGGRTDYQPDACTTFLPYHPKEDCSTSNLSSCAPLCYKRFIHISSYNMSWEDALNYCKTQHNTAGLLRIESEDDQRETERELRRQKISGPVWIGLRKSRLFGFWIWSNGLFLGSWSNWTGGSAPDPQLSQYCGALEEVDGAFEWIDQNCFSQIKALCECRNSSPKRRSSKSMQKFNW